MHREDIAHRVSWAAMSFLGLAGILYLFNPAMNLWKLPIISAVILSFVWTWLLSTPGKPEQLTPRLLDLNKLQGRFTVTSDLLLVGDKCGPERNTGKLGFHGTVVEYQAIVRKGLIAELRLVALDGGTFETTSLKLPVDSGFLAFFDAGCCQRGVKEQFVKTDVLHVLASAELLSLVVLDRDGLGAGMVVGTGDGDGVYQLHASNSEARLIFL